jgi:hypothetical protein
MHRVDRDARVTVCSLRHLEFKTETLRLSSEIPKRSEGSLFPWKRVAALRRHISGNRDLSLRFDISEKTLSPRSPRRKTQPLALRPRASSVTRGKTNLNFSIDNISSLPQYLVCGAC